MRLAIVIVLLAACGNSSGSEADNCGTRCCHGDADCVAPDFACLAPGAFAGCGACRAGDGCQADADCAAMGVNMICEVPACTCDSEKACVGGCVDDMSCGAGFVCGADRRCARQPCSAATDCPDYFVCGSQGTCMRQPCQSDDDCTMGSCVNNGCYEALGQCSSLPA